LQLKRGVEAVEFSRFALPRTSAISAAIFFGELCRDEFFVAVIETIEMTDVIDATRRISPL
jgi:hypothetical protein